MKQIKIELLAPARNLECGIEAINHGADAVYIGAPKFGARAAAGNSLRDIEKLVNYAHLYYARIYVALNTILHDEELAETESLIWDLYRAGVDALIVQDMGITCLNLPPIPLHASTQMDNRTVEKVRFLSEAGFGQVVLARELSLGEIQKIHEACPQTALEVFVHGALCVSYSGQCYASQACFGRSANRGACAQFCRLPFNLVDADDKLIVKDKHLLSLKDMNRIHDLEALIDSGVTSLKIEGRLKDVSYVKNVTAAYRQQLDLIFQRRSEYIAASSGHCQFSFVPQLSKSFSRGATTYFLYGREKNITSFDSPKSLGEEMGHVKELHRDYFTVSGVLPFHNGDGACFFNEAGKLQGFRINRVEGNKLYILDMPLLKKKTKIYRNVDKEFEQLLTKPSSTRKIGLNIRMWDVPSGFALELGDEDGNHYTQAFDMEKLPARTPQQDHIKGVLGKLGSSSFVAEQIELDFQGEWFIPASQLTELRRQVVDGLLRCRHINYHNILNPWKSTTHAYPVSSLTYLGNVMNKQAEAFYHCHGVKQIAPAFEQQAVDNAVLMFCKHCLRYSMGWCPTHQNGQSPYKEPYFLEMTDGRRFKLSFDCKNCQMKVEAACE